MIILLQCTDRVGLVADIAKIMADENMNIISMREFVNTEENRFFIRIETQKTVETGLLRERFLSALPDDTKIEIDPEPVKKVVIMVTKEHHCLGDILIRNHFKTLGASVACVIGNYDYLRDIAERLNVPFHYITHEGVSKEKFEQSLLQIIQQHQPDYIILAKFMRILSPGFVSQFPMKIINIHHSFLPAFIGANPYRQAYERGVKLIGATAHFVTNDLDEGPIITQQIIPVNHAHTVKNMVAAGQEIEKAVLAKSLQLVFENRVMVYKNKTVIFDN